MSNTLTNLILGRLTKRRAELKKLLEDALARPASYSIQGSYSQTGQTPEALRAQISELDEQIAALATDDAGLTRVYPCYRGGPA